MTKKLVVRTSVLIVLAAVVLMTAACPAKDAAVAVNKYLATLSAVQDGEVAFHKDALSKIDLEKEKDKLIEEDTRHIAFQRAAKVANRGGDGLNQAVIVAAKGGDPSQYVDLATKSFDEVTNLVKVTNSKELQTMVNVAAAALKDAITLVQAIEVNTKKAAVKAENHPAKHQMPASFFWAFMLFGAVVSLEGATELLNLLLKLSPVAFQYIVNVTKSLAGKSVDEVTAMNDDLVNKIDSTADAEIAQAEAEIATAKGEAPQQ